MYPKPYSIYLRGTIVFFFSEEGLEIGALGCRILELLLAEVLCWS